MDEREKAVVILDSGASISVVNRACMGESKCFDGKHVGVVLLKGPIAQPVEVGEFFSKSVL